MAVKYQNEKQFQGAIVLWFSQEYPELYGSLFEVNNSVYSLKHAMSRRAMGMVAGVSDLILIANGNVAGIELKHPKTKHSKAHIQQQTNWGKHIESQGGMYIMSDNEEEVKDFIISIVEQKK
ncbi:MAG: hypothetical protein PF486_14075 [Prolixibacteraceae bacterium]|jgi:hypothetical protein|nr:hypothetical protein [Prolixibacteraceae bacterium]